MDEFLKDLRDECLKEGESYFGPFREILFTFDERPKDGLIALLKICHNMKGNLQAVGFTHCSQFVDELETVLIELNGKLTNCDLSNVMGDEGNSDLERLECILSECLEQLEEYFAELAQNLNDKENFKTAKVAVLDKLREWSLSGNAVTAKTSSEEDEKVTGPKEGNGYVVHLRGFLDDFKSDSAKNLNSIIDIINEVKNNLYDLQFNFCVEWLEHFCHTIGEIAQKIGETSPEVLAEDDNIEVLSFFLNEFIDNLETYLDSLNKNKMDSIDLKNSRMQAFTFLDGWELKEQTPEALASAGQEGNNDVVISVSNNKNGDEEAPEILQPLIKYVVCKNGNRLFAIPADNVVEVIRLREMSPLPARRGNVKGLCNLRGEVLPILNLDDTLMNELELKEERGERYIVVGKENDYDFGFEIDQVHHVLELDSRNFQTIENLSDSCDEKLISHATLVGDDTILILDFKKVVAA